MSTPPRDLPPPGSGANNGEPPPPAPTTPPPPTLPNRAHHHHHHHLPSPFPFIPPLDGDIHIFPMGIPPGMPVPHGIPGMEFGPPPPGGLPPGFIPSVGIPAGGPMGFMPGTPAGVAHGTAPFTFFMSFFNGPSSNQPDPAAAEELVRSLPTVSKGLFDRINKVVVAEQKQSGDDEEPGWKCGVCLDGMDGQVDETGVKGLPCNHLFHSACLQPWFETHHTCPTCRLDLDPLDTLRGSTREGGRPTPTTGATRARPYGARPNPPPGAPGQDNGPQFTFVWHMPAPPPDQPTPQAPENAPTPQTPGTVPRTPTPSQTPAPPSSHLSPPTQTFNIPLRASPAPMGRSASDPGSQSPLTTAADGSTPTQTPQDASARPIPQRRTHINVEALDGPRAPNSSPGPQPSTPGTSTAPPAPAEPVAAPFLPPNPTPFPRPSATHPHQRVPHFRTVINIGPPPRVTPHTHVDDDLPTQAPNPPPPRSSTAPAPSKAIIRESLDTWVETRERALGWRCDAPICFSAPTSDDPHHDTLPEPTISIFSSSQVALPHSGDSFELHACEHRWHRSCLESTAKTSRRWTEGTGEDEGKVWVRCDRCRKDGWVPRLDTTDMARPVVV